MSGLRTHATRTNQNPEMSPRPRRSATTIDLIGDDLLHNVIGRLDAASFAAAACVCRCWTAVSHRVLSRPKLSSAFSLNSNLELAVEDVLSKVLSQPIRPHFAFVYVGPSFHLQQAHQLIVGKLGSRTPVVSIVPAGIIGNDALSDEFNEIQWEVTDEEDPDDVDVSESLNYAISLVVGFTPGLKVDVIPLLKQNEELQNLMIDRFVMDIREYSISNSGQASPSAIVMFGDIGTDMKPVLQKMDYAMFPETVIVGDASCQFACGDDFIRNTTSSKDYSSAAVALVFTKDRNKPHGTGETQFHVTISPGLSPIGPTYKAASVREKHTEGSTWLTARVEGSRENLDGEAIMRQIFDLLGDRIKFPAFYIGVTKRRKCSIGTGKVRWTVNQAFHEVLGDNQEYLFVGDVGIKTGDSFRFYQTDSSVALSSCRNVSNHFMRLKQDFNIRGNHQSRTAISNGKTTEVFGGMIFTCCGRGEPFFGQHNVDSTPFLENFPGVPFSGSFCGREIGRGNSGLYNQGSEEQGSVSCCLHVYSAVYLVMSYTP